MPICFREPVFRDTQCTTNHSHREVNDDFDRWTYAEHAAKLSFSVLGKISYYCKVKAILAVVL